MEHMIGCNTSFVTCSQTLYQLINAMWGKEGAWELYFMRLTARDTGNIHYSHKKPQQFKDIFSFVNK